MVINWLLKYGYRTNLYIVANTERGMDGVCMSKALPKSGDVVPAVKFHVSKCNVRFEEPFGEDDEDQRLVRQISLTKKLVEPFKARVEKDGFGVYAGGRRFRGAVEAGFVSFTVGKDVLITEVSDEDAVDESIIENIGFLRKSMDPIKRAKRINERVSSLPGGLTSYGRRIGVAKQTLSEWLKVLELSEGMQKAVTKDLLFFTDAVKVTRMDIEPEAQDKLAEVLETEGMEKFQKELQSYSEKKLKRGIPAGKYLVIRVVLDKFYDPDMKLDKILRKLAEARHEKRDEAVKWALQNPEEYAQQIKTFA